MYKCNISPDVVKLATKFWEDVTAISIANKSQVGNITQNDYQYMFSNKLSYW